MKRSRKTIYLAGLLYSVSLALTYYINSSFLASVLGEKSVGLVYTLASFASLSTLLMVPAIFRRIGAYRFLLVTGAISALAYLGLASVWSSWGIAIVFILSFSFNILVLFVLDEFLKIFSRNQEMGSVRGIYLSIVHIALIATQLAFWLFLGSLPFHIIYLCSFAVTLLFIGTALFFLKNIPEPGYDRVQTLSFVGKFFKNPRLLKAYVLSFLLQIFYCWMIIYTPIYLSLHLGFSWNQIGAILAVMLVPFLILPYYLGKHSDKFGERKMMMAGFLIAALSTLMLFLVDLREVWVWAVLLLLTRVGASSIEVMADAYFFKHISPENEEFVGVYRSTAPFAYIVGPLLASGVLIVAPSFKYIYLVLAAILLYGVYLASTISKRDI